jgi:hypothetical protein
VRGAWGLGSLVGLAMGWACGGSSFTCSDDAQCQPGGGSCVEGYCAFPSDECSSGLQWSDYAGPVSGTCVPEGGTDPGATDASTGPADPTDTAPGTSASTLPPLETSADETSDPLPAEVEFRDDALRGEFGAGDMRGVAWTGDRLALAAAGVGTFTSRVYDAGGPVAWQTVQWEPDGAYGKPLPDGGAAEVGYPQGVDMADNVLLLHLDGVGGQAEWADETVVLDASGAGNHGVLETTGPPVALVPGIFGTALDDRWESRIEILTANAPALAFGTDDFTWALWVRMNSACTTNQVYMGVDDQDGGFDVYPHLWLGCTDDPWAQCQANTTAPRAGGVFRSVHSLASDGGSYCNPTAIDDDAWHHLVVVKQGHANATLSLYVDGALGYTGPAGFAAPIEYPHDPAFTIGAFSRDTYRAVAVLDEVAVWRRALGPGEVEAMYQRGVASLGVAVRVCQLPGCADDPPWGPTLVDPPQALAAGSELPLEGQPVGQYAQYRLDLAGVSGAPALRAVTIRGMR